MEDILRILNNGEYFIGLLCLSSVKLYGLYTVRKQHMKLDFRHVGKVSELYIYPVKSCEGVQVSTITADYDTARVGPLRDRHLLVTSSDYKAISRREEPNLVKIRITWSEDGMTLEANELDVFKIPFDLSPVGQNGVVVTKVIGEEVSGIDVGQEASDWLRQVTGKEGYRLLYSGPSISKRKVKDGPSVHHKKAADKDLAAFQNMTSLSLISQESLDAANKRVPIDVNNRRLRMNIIVNNCKEFDEDTWKTVKIGNCVLKRLKMCNRCQQTTLDPDTGEKHKQEEPMKTLKQFRMLPGYRTPCMGTCLVVDVPGQINVGDNVFAIRD